MLLELFNFCVQKKILTFAHNKSEIIGFMNNVLQSCIDDNPKDVKKLLENTPEKIMSEKISAFECMKTVLDEEEL